MDVHIQLTRRGELSAQIYRQLLEAIVDGRLPDGTRLPPTRELAKRLAVSRNTVGVAYERLVADGVLEGRVGAGSFVSTEVLPARVARGAPPGAVTPLPIWRDLLPSTVATSPAAYDFSVGVPDASLFPVVSWRRLLANEWRTAPAARATYAEPAGDPRLRAAIARHIGVSRAVSADADDVVVTQGAQQAFDLIGRVLIAKGACVAIENPGYPQVQRLYRSFGARIVAVPVDDEGLVVEALPPSATLVYVTPSHQFPLGSTMSIRRRTALLAWAERSGAAIVEDDYDTEFRFGGRPLDPLQRLDRSGRVIYVGTFSKVLLPTLRLGFLVAPTSLRAALQAAKRLTDWHGEVATQAALARFVEEGLLSRHIRKTSRVYAERRLRIMDGIERRCGRWLRVLPSEAGLHLAAALRSDVAIDLDAVVRHAEARGVHVRSMASLLGASRVRQGLVIGYGAIAAGRIDEGLRRLAASFGRSHERRR